MKERLQNIYRQQDKIPPLIDGLFKEQPIKDYYVKLSILLSQSVTQSISSEAILGREQEIELEKIFDNGNALDSNRVLILGGAGVGKTTLMQYIANKWGNGSLWSDKFDYVYKVSLKQLLTERCTFFIASNKPEIRLEAFIAYNLLGGDTYKATELVNNGEVRIDEKTLLLVDGYDEIKHLDIDSAEYREIKDAIMGGNEKYGQHSCIMTSRPNAVDPNLKKLFGTLVKSEGLDKNGINDYLNRQFKNDKTKLANLINLLDKNPHLQELFKIPVNIAMLCNIVNENAHQAVDINNMQDLYQKMILTLGKRFFSKHPKYSPNTSNKVLVEKLQNGEFNIRELKVLQELALYGFKMSEALIFPGASNNGNDVLSHTIQSAINRCAKKWEWSQEKKPTISDVCNYGILKVEMTLNARTIEENDTAIKDQLFSFIHLTFQEYLAANEIVTSLLSYQDKQGRLPAHNPEIVSICQFLAENRDNPRYFMLLKFMSGIVARKGNEDLLQAFWESMTCNVDGILHLGNDKEVELLMHLLGQIDKKSYQKVTTKIPNYSTIEKYIDATINAHGILKWVDTIKASNYLSAAIQAALLSSLNIELIGELIATLDNNIPFRKEQSLDCQPYEYIQGLITELFNKSYGENNHQQLLKLYKFIIKVTPFINLSPATKLQIVDSLLVKINDKSSALLVADTLTCITKNINMLMRIT